MSVLAGIGVLVAGVSSLLGYALLGIAVVLVGVAMRRNTDEEDGPESVDNEDGTDETEMKAKGETGGAGGWF